MPTQHRYKYGAELGRGSFGVIYAVNLCGHFPRHLANLRTDHLDSAQLAWLSELNEDCNLAMKRKGAGSLKRVVKALLGRKCNQDGSFAFACKSLPCNEFDDLVTIDREVHMLKRCRGPGVLLLVDNFEQGNAYHIVTNRCYGTIRERIGTSGDPASLLRAQQARKWSAQLLRAVIHVHSKGVIHRDVKPANVFCTSAGPDSDIVLGDFGLADTADIFGKVPASGSWAYWDMDAFDGSMTTHSDLWAVGVSVLELCCGTHLRSVPSTKDPSANADLELATMGFAGRGPSRASSALPVSSLKLLFERRLCAGVAVEQVEACGMLADVGLHPFLRAILDVAKRPASSELLELLP